MHALFIIATPGERQDSCLYTSCWRLRVFIKLSRSRFLRAPSPRRPQFALANYPFLGQPVLGSLHSQCLSPPPCPAHSLGGAQASCLHESCWRLRTTRTWISDRRSPCTVLPASDPALQRARTGRPWPPLPSSFHLLSIYVTRLSQQVVLLESAASCWADQPPPLPNTSRQNHTSLLIHILSDRPLISSHRPARVRRIHDRCRIH